jgi:lysophospholipase L1-like esterase
VFFIVRRSDGIIAANDCRIFLTYFNSNDGAVGTLDTITHFNTIVEHTYNSAAAKFRSYFNVKSGATFDNVEFEYIVLFAKPLSEYIMPGMIADNYESIPLTFESKTGYYASNGSFATYNNIWGATVDVTPTRKYRLNYHSFYGMSETVFFDSNGNLIQAVTSHNDDAQYSKDFYVPVNASTMLIQALGSTESGVSGRTSLSYQNGKRMDGSTLDVYEIPYKDSDVGTALDTLQNTNKSVLFGKKIAYNGDSICESRLTGTAANGGGYAKLIADATGGTYDNKAVSGGILASAVPSGTMPHSVVNTLGQLPDDADLYCIEGGLNDFWRDVPLGDFSATDYNATVDATTVCGALEHIIRAITYYHVGKPLVFVLVHKATATINPNNAGYTFDQMREKMIGILNKYAIPYYDAYLYSGLNGENGIQSTTFLTANSSGQGDGIHPNEAGYRRYYVPQLIALFESVMPVLE